MIGRALDAVADVDARLRVLHSLFHPHAAPTAPPDLARRFERLRRRASRSSDGKLLTLATLMFERAFHPRNDDRN